MTFGAPEFAWLLPVAAVLAWRWPRLGLLKPLRALIVLGLIFVAMDPRMQRREQGMDLFVLLDRSDSTESRIDQGLPEWKKLLEAAKPSRNDRLRWIDFAVDVVESGKIGTELTGSRGETRTAAALQMVASLAEDERPSRMLIFTDGYATEPLQETAELLKKRGIALDFRLLPGRGDADVRVAQFSIADRVQVGEPYLLKLELRGQASKPVPVRIYRNEKLLLETEINLTDGLGTAEFTDRLVQGGVYAYEAEIRPVEDAHLGNNRAQRWLEVIGGPRIVLITHAQPDPLVQALSPLGIQIDAIAPAAATRATLAGAKAVIINNVPAHELSREFLNGMDFFVREQGGGLLMVGGRHSFGAGGYAESVIDPLLPVTMELKSEHRKLMVALAIVMDRSGSMTATVGGGRTKMDLANQGAASAISLLGSQDQITVFAVDSQPQCVIPLAQIGGSQQKIIQRVRKVQAGGGGIYVYVGLEAAWKELQKSQHGIRHIILFSDAQDSEEPGAYEALIAKMRKQDVTLSVIGLGTRADVDARLLDDIARRGNGRAFFSNNAQELPQIFSQETVTIARSAFLEEVVATQTSGKWQEISPSMIELPAAVDGYNLSYAREDAIVTLIAKDEYSAPLMAHTRRGLGRTMAVSFPLSGAFSQQVRAWPGYADLVQTIVRFLAGDEIPSGLALRHRLVGNQLTLDLLYDQEQWAESFVRQPPRIVLESGDAAARLLPNWRRMQPGHFTLTYQMAVGSQLRGAVQLGGRALPFGPISSPISAEWAFDPARVADLKQVVAETGGRELINLSDAWKAPETQQVRTLRFVLLAILLGVILLEALQSRLGWQLPSGWNLAAWKTKRIPRVVSKPAAQEVAKEEITPPPSPSAPEMPEEASDRSERFRRAKNRR